MENKKEPRLKLAVYFDDELGFDIRGDMFELLALLGALSETFLKQVMAYLGEEETMDVYVDLQMTLLKQLGVSENVKSEIMQKILKNIQDGNDYRDPIKSKGNG